MKAVKVETALAVLTEVIKGLTVEVKMVAEVAEMTAEVVDIKDKMAINEDSEGHGV